MFAGCPGLYVERGWWSEQYFMCLNSSGASDDSGINDKQQLYVFCLQPMSSMPLYNCITVLTLDIAFITHSPFSPLTHDVLAKSVQADQLYVTTHTQPVQVNSIQNKIPLTPTSTPPKANPFSNPPPPLLGAGSSRKGRFARLFLENRPRKNRLYRPLLLFF